MDRSERALARTVWHQLANRNQWQLIADTERLLDAVLARRDSAVAPGDSAVFFRSAFQAIYSERLYQGFVDREERSAYELWLMFLRLAVRGGETEQDASDQAQEAVARVLAKLDQVQSPQRFLSWAMMVFRTTQRDLRPKRVTVSLAPENDEPVVEPVDPADHIAELEDRLVAQELRELLRAAVPNDLERFTLLRCVILGDDPRDVARDLGLPLYRTRVAKSRALQRLRDNQACMTFIFPLDPSRQEAAPMTGGQDHE